MDRLDFEFKKSRGLGELIQDYISLYKRIFKHFNRSILRFILPFVAIFLCLIYIGFNYASSFFFDTANSGFTAFAVAVIIGILVTFFYFIFIPTYGIEYMFILEERGSTDFDGSEVRRAVIGHLRKYIAFFFAATLISFLLAIPLIAVILVSSFIPIIGQIASGVLISILTVIYFGALMLYRKSRAPLFDSFMASFRLMRKKLFIYGLSAYIFQFLISICLGILTIIPAVVIFLIAFNSVSMNQVFFMSITGRIILSIGGTILFSVYTIASIYMATFFSLIYYSSLEATEKEGTLDKIDQIGSSDEDLV